MSLTDSKRRRVRRSPEQARALILDGAKRVLAEKGPDGASLSAVADEVGVSHSLVVHYFGSYDALVEAAVSDQLRRVGAKVVAQALKEPERGVETLIEGLFEALRSPEMGRTVGWALLTGRLESKDLFDRIDQNPGRLPQLIETYVRETRGENAPSRKELEFLLVLMISAALGYALSGGVLWQAIGREDDEDCDLDFRSRLVGLVRERMLGGKTSEEET